MGLLAASEAHVLDLAGPCEAFSRANEVVAELQSASEPVYQLELAAIALHYFDRMRLARAIIHQG
ncbi:MAG: hypothetical protein JO151_18255 [Verrucomicrobia bacterium]|nr:hypothetical protein [Verrucomicrobiota bacterium]